MKHRAEFVRAFLLPLVAGGEVRVGAPLGASGLLRFMKEDRETPRRGADEAFERRVRDARFSVAGELQITPTPPPLDEEALRLAVALHDLLFLFHPSLPGNDAGHDAGRDGKNRMHPIAQGALALARLPRTNDPQILIARHTILHLFPSLARTDVRVTFWAGRAEFRGQQPPARLTVWPHLRRVNEERFRVSCLGEAASDTRGGADVVRTLFCSSPLTDLLHPVRSDPPLDLSDVDYVLGDPELCRMVAHRYLDDGPGVVGGALAQALISLLSAHQPASARFALALLCHLHLCLLSSVERGEPQIALTRLAARGDAALRDFCGLYAAMKRVAPALAAPADLSRDARMTMLSDQHAAACAASCGESRVIELGHLVARAVGTANLVAA